jgi:hypothetical protein
MAAEGEASAVGDATAGTLLREPRWPPAVALVSFMALNIGLRLWLPGGSGVRVPWLLPAVEAMLLVVLLGANPGNVTKPRRLHRVSVVFVLVLVAAALWSTALLVYDLIKGHGVSNSPGQLLASGAVIWLGNNLAFALLYWLIDSGGPMARSVNPRPIDFAFTQQLSPELAPPGWRPVFLDYPTSASRTRPRSARPTSCRSRTGRSTRCSCSRRSRWLCSDWSSRAR